MQRKKRRPRAIPSKKLGRSVLSLSLSLSLSISLIELRTCTRFSTHIHLCIHACRLTHTSTTKHTHTLTGISRARHECLSPYYARILKGALWAQGLDAPTKSSLNRLRTRRAGSRFWLPLCSHVRLSHAFSLSLSLTHTHTHTHFKPELRARAPKSLNIISWWTAKLEENTSLVFSHCF